jgi:hypothetical protein
LIVVIRANVALQARVLEAMLLLLDHSNYELLYSICGTLINFTIDRYLAAMISRTSQSQDLGQNLIQPQVLQ